MGQVKRGAALLAGGKEAGNANSARPVSSYLPSISLRRSQPDIWSIAITTTMVRMMM